MESAAQIKKISISMGNGNRCAFNLEVNSKSPAQFVLSLRKSGSSLFSSMSSAIAEANGVNVVDIPGRMFELGCRYSDWNSHPDIRKLLWRGNTYIGFRDAPTGFYGDPIFETGAKILLVRDPRDVLVSEYFSNAYSHSLPKEGADGSILADLRQKALKSSLEQYVLSRVVDLNRTVNSYKALVKRKDVLILRYEDVIFHKDEWCRVIAKHFKMEVCDSLVSNILGWADIRPEVEVPDAFVRNVTPGDHRRKLSSDIISQVNSGLSEVWKEFGYDLA